MMTVCFSFESVECQDENFNYKPDTVTVSAYLIRGERFI